MTKIFLTRHGQTIWNLEGRMQGWLDSSLTELGVNQAQWFGRKIKDMGIDVIYSSSSGRAVDTADIINRYIGVDINLSDDLREIGLGKLQGLTQEEIKVKYPDEYNDYYNDPVNYIPVGDGETFNELLMRVQRKFTRIIDENCDKNILVVTHTMVIKMLICMIKNQGIERFWDKPYIRQGSLTVVESINGQMSLLECADISHHKFLVKEFNE